MVRIGNPGGNQYGGGQPPYGQPGPYQQGPHQPGPYQQGPYFGAGAGPGAGPGGHMPPSGPPRRGRLKPILGWTGVVIGGVLSTVLASYIVDRINESDKKEKPLTSDNGVPFPEGYTPPPGKAVTNGVTFRASGDTGTWPDACEMLSDTEIVNAIPDARIVGSREGKKDTSVASKNYACTIRIQLPNLQSQSEPALLTFTIGAIGDAGPVEDEFEKDKGEASKYSGYEDLENKLFVDSAFRVGTKLHLYKNEAPKDGRPPTAGYYVVVDVKADTKDSSGAREASETWTRKVGPAIVRVLNVKMKDD